MTPKLGVRVKRQIALIAVSLALVSCGKREADSMAVTAHPTASSTAPAPDAKPPKFGISGPDRAAMKVSFSMFSMGCMGIMARASLLEEHGTPSGWQELQTEADDLMEKSAKPYRAWVQKLASYPHVLRALKAVRAAQYECSERAVIGIRTGVVGADSARGMWQRDYESAQRNLDAELDAIPIAADSDGLKLPSGLE